MLKTTFSAITALLVSSVSLANEVVTNPTWDLDRLDQTTTSLDGQYVKPPVNTECKTLHVVTLENDTPALETLLQTALHSCVGLQYHFVGTNGASISMLSSKLDEIASSAPTGDVVLVRLASSYNSSFNSSVDNLWNSGKMVVVTAGAQNGNSCNYSPQSASGVYVIGDTLINDMKVSNSNYGSCIDAYAPASFEGAGAANTAATMANCGAATGVIDPTYMRGQMTAKGTTNTGITIVNNTWCR